MSINSKHPLSIFAHELGHTFANLAEEYVVPSGLLPNGSKNCQSSCSGFDREIDGCFEECTKSVFIRSIDNGIMRSPDSSQYGIFNEAIIEEEILRQSSLPQRGLTSRAISQLRECDEESYFLIVFDPKTGKAVTARRHIGCAVLDEGAIDLLVFTDAPSEKDPRIIEGDTFIIDQFIFVTVPAEEFEEEDGEESFEVAIIIEEGDSKKLIVDVSKLEG